MFKLLSVVCHSLFVLQTTNLFQRDAIVLQEKEAVVTDGSLHFLDETIDDRGVFRIEKRQINRFELRKVVLLLSHRRGIPRWHDRLAWQVSGRWVERSGSRHFLKVYEDLCGRFVAITAHVALVYIS